MAQDGPEMTQDRPKMTQDRPENVDFVLVFAIFGTPRTPRMRNSCQEPMFSLQKSLRFQTNRNFQRKFCQISLDSLKEAVHARKMAKIGPKQAQDDPRQAQDGPKMAQDRLKTGSRWPKTSPR